jgi:hypothetical protein
MCVRGSKRGSTIFCTGGKMRRRRRKMRGIVRMTRNPKEDSKHNKKKSIIRSSRCLKITLRYLI